MLENLSVHSSAIVISEARVTYDDITVCGEHCMGTVRNALSNCRLRKGHNLCIVMSVCKYNSEHDLIKILCGFVTELT